MFNYIIVIYDLKTKLHKYIYFFEKNINIDNIDKLSQKQILHIGRMYDAEYYDHYKKRLFFKWFKKNLINTSSFYRKSNKMLKKMSIDLNDIESQELEKIKPREFTENRSFKTIEAPYKENINLDRNIFFFYKGVNVYEKNNLFFKLLYKTEVNLSKKEIVFYDRYNDVVSDYLEYKNIKQVTLNNFSVVIHIKGNKKLYLRFYDNDLLYISLIRAFSFKKNDIAIEKENDATNNTSERTIEAILNI